MSGIENDDANPQLTRIAARDAIKARQILINAAQDGPIAPDKTSHAQLVEKIKAALKAITKEGNKTLEMRAVTQYRNGGTIIEMLTEEDAKYLKQSENKEEFIKHLDPKATFKERAYPVIIQFAPLTFDPDDIEQIRELERENNWEQETITMARWVKPPNKRTNHQQVAHIMLTMKDPKSANDGIRNGVTLNQARLQMKKNKREPIRCAKCQNYGHIARECLSHHDTCANC
ncbi:hypothetical protein DEU56DRAFT_961827, partial [Suillus clintonianus]|uniref:uncharacterized protein n=1 Tax=Suillus clintonianus TaxID=1904413 RepID=UPI001B87E0DE